MGKTSTLTYVLQARIDKLEQGLNRANQKMSSFQRRTSAISSQIQSQFAVMFSVTAVTALGASTLDLIRKMDGLNRALKAVTGDQEAFNRAQLFLHEVATINGQDIATLTDQYTKFIASTKASGLSTNALNDIFKRITKSAAVLGLSTEELEGALRAINQMFSKGTIQAEEIRGQLSERLPGAFSILAKSMGVTEQQLGNLLKQGKVMAADVLPDFAKEFEKAVGADKVKSVDTLNAAFGRFQTAWTDLITSIENGEGAIAKGIKSLLDLGQEALKTAKIISDLQKDSPIVETSKDLLGFINPLKSLMKYNKAALESFNNFFGVEERFKKAAARGREFGKVNEDLSKTITDYSSLVNKSSEADEKKKKKLKEAEDAAKAFREELEKLNMELGVMGTQAGFDLMNDLKPLSTSELFRGIDKPPVFLQDDASNIDEYFDSLAPPTEEIAEEWDYFLDTLQQKQKKLDEINNKVIEQAKAMDAVVANTIGNALAGIAENIGTGQLDKIFSGLLETIAQGIVDMGKLLIQMGLMEKAFFKAPPAAKIAIGLAAVAVGSAFKAAAARTANAGGGGGGGGAQNRSFQGSTLNGQSIKVDGQFTVAGKDLKLVLSKADSINQRARIGG